MTAMHGIEKFDGEGDFPLWRMKMKAFLRLQKVDNALEDPSKLPPNITDQEKIEMNDTAFCTLILHLSDNILKKVMDAKSAAELWKKLETMHLKKSSPAKIGLLEKFFRFKMDPSKKVDENLVLFDRICCELADNGEEFTDEHQAVILLNSLPESYEYQEVKYAVKSYSEALTSDTVLKALKHWEKMVEEYDDPNRAECLTCFYKPTDQNTKLCYICDKEGHLKRDCPQKNKPSNKNNEKKLLTEPCYLEWVISTGSPFHITFHKHWLSDFNLVEGGSLVSVFGGDGCRIKGVGSVELKLHDGTIKILKSVMYVPGYSRNLLCLNKIINREGWTIQYGNDGLSVFRGSELMMKGIEKNGLDILDGNTVLPPPAAGSID